MTMFFFKNCPCDLDLGPRTLKLKFAQNIVILYICVKQNHNQLMNKDARVMTKFFSKNSHCDLDLNPITLKRKLVRGIVIPNICMKLYQN